LIIFLKGKKVMQILKHPILAIYLIATGVIVLVGWFFDIKALSSIVGFFSPMSPVSAINFMLFGIWLAIQHKEHTSIKKYSAILPGIIFFVSFFRILQFLGIINLENSKLKLIGEGMPPASVINFLVIAIFALFFFKGKYERSRIAPILLIACLYISLIYLTGYLFALSSLTMSETAPPMTFYSSITFVAIFFSLLRDPFIELKNVIRNSITGNLVFKILPLLFFIPFLVGYIILFGQRGGYYNTDLGTAIYVVTVALLSTLLVAYFARILFVQEQELRLSEQRFLNAFNFSGIGMALISLNGKWLKVNKSLVELLGYSDRELSNLTFQDITFPEDLDIDLENVNKLLNNEINTYQMEKRYYHKDGHLIWAMLTVSLVRDSKGNPQFFISQIADISSTKYLDETLDLMKKKDEFMSIASHELKTPLTSMKGFLQILERNVKKDGNRVYETLMAKANKPLNKLTGIVNDLLDVTRIQNGKLEINKKHFSVDSLISDCLVQIEFDLQGKEPRVDGNIEEVIYGDKFRLEDVLINLLTNAAKYSPQNDEIIITATKLPDKIKIAVTDFGIGISKDKLPYVFDRFFRVENTSQNYPGLGMGLYISSEIIKLHGGEIGVESELGKGSTFWFTLPVFNN
jgi:PAS domain S-box-containing protein